MDSRSVGSAYEDKACDYIRRSGGRVLYRNFRSRMGEIDIVAEDGDTLCFVEVKYRRTNANGHPAEAVGPKKQFTICRVSDYYRMKHSLSEERSYRFDVIGIIGDEITWYKDAFPYIPY